eukprot:m.147772 g.147772  ORF g.147772 m.147772 type:complete len:767 (+) comp13243_c0_seq1:58-2358(+)
MSSPLLFGLKSFWIEWAKTLNTVTIHDVQETNSLPPFSLLNIAPSSPDFKLVTFDALEVVEEGKDGKEVGNSDNVIIFFAFVETQEMASEDDANALDGISNKQNLTQQTTFFGRLKVVKICVDRNSKCDCLSAVVVGSMPITTSRPSSFLLSWSPARHLFVLNDISICVFDLCGGEAACQTGIQEIEKGISTSPSTTSPTSSLRAFHQFQKNNTLCRDARWCVWSDDGHSIVVITKHSLYTSQMVEVMNELRMSPLKEVIVSINLSLATNIAIQRHEGFHCSSSLSSHQKKIQQQKQNCLIWILCDASPTVFSPSNALFVNHSQLSSEHPSPLQGLLSLPLSNTPQIVDNVFALSLSCDGQMVESNAYKLPSGCRASCVCATGVYGRDLECPIACVGSSSSSDLIFLSYDRVRNVIQPSSELVAGLHDMCHSTKCENMKSKRGKCVQRCLSMVSCGVENGQRATLVFELKETCPNDDKADIVLPLFGSSSQQPNNGQRTVQTITVSTSTTTNTTHTIPSTPITTHATVLATGTEQEGTDRKAKNAKVSTTVKRKEDVLHMVQKLASTYRGEMEDGSGDDSVTSSPTANVGGFDTISECMDEDFRRKQMLALEKARRNMGSSSQTSTKVSSTTPSVSTITSSSVSTTYTATTTLSSLVVPVISTTSNSNKSEVVFKREEDTSIENISLLSSEGSRSQTSTPRISVISPREEPPSSTSLRQTSTSLTVAHFSMLMERMSSLEENICQRIGSLEQRLCGIEHHLHFSKE